jgi:hypothetical protein
MALPGETNTPSEIATNLTFTVDSTTPAGELPVTYPKYVNDGAGNYVVSPTRRSTRTSGSHTKSRPPRRICFGDMFDFLTPGFGRVPALSNVPAANTGLLVANVANWGITYRQSVTVVNNDSRSRTFALTLNNFSTSGGHIAYLNDAGTWAFTRLQGLVVISTNPTVTRTTTPFTYRTFTVQPGTSSTIDGYFILGSPSVGAIRHAVEVTN